MNIFDFPEIKIAILGMISVAIGILTVKVELMAVGIVMISTLILRR